MKGWCLLLSCPPDLILAELSFWPKGCKKHLNPKSFMEAAGFAGSLHGSGFRTASSLASMAPGDSFPQPVSFSPIVRAQSTLLNHLAPFPRPSFHYVLLHMFSCSIWFGSGCSRVMTTLHVCPSSFPHCPSSSRGCFPFHLVLFPPSVPSSSRRPDVSDTYSRFPSNPVGLDLLY